MIVPPSRAPFAPQALRSSVIPFFFVTDEGPERRREGEKEDLDQRKD